MKGFVTDVTNGEPLQGANVLIYQSDSLLTGAATDAQGAYIVQGLPSDTVVVEVSFIGYETTQDRIRLRSGEVRNLNITLSPGTSGLEEVVVEASGAIDAADVTAGHQRIRPENLARVPTPDVSGDLVSYLSAQPGIVSTGDRGGQLFIRGGEPTQNVVHLDEMRLYKPFHVLGFYSAFPSAIIQQTDVYAGGFPARYSGGLSSVIDVSSRNGNKQAFGGSVSVSSFLSSAFAEGPLVRGDVSFLASARRSVLDYGASQYLEDPLPYQFSDLFGKVHARTGPASRLSISGLWTTDEGTLGTDLSPVSVPEGDSLARQTSQIRWENGGLGAQYLVLPEFLPVRATLHASRSWFSMSQGPASDPTRRSQITHTRLGLEARFPGDPVQVDAGWSAEFLTLGTELGGLYQNVSRSGVGPSQIGLYIAPEWTSGHVHIRPGVRLQFYNVRFDPYLEPRVHLRWERGMHQISAAGGLYQQELVGLHDRRDATSLFTAWTNIPKKREEVEDVREGRLSRSEHGILGYQIQPASWMRVSLEGYYKRYANLFIGEWTAFPRFTTRLQPADGRSFGAEARVTLQRSDVQLYLNYGYSNTVYWAQQASLELWYGQEELRFTPPHDRRHQINILASGSRWGWDLSIRWAFGSGRPFSKAIGFDGFTLIDDLERLDRVPGRRRVIYAEPFGARLPTYHRLDVSLQRSFTLGAAMVTAQGTLINAYDRPNIFYLDVFTLQRADQLPVVPTVGLKVAFNRE